MKRYGHAPTQERRYRSSSLRESFLELGLDRFREPCELRLDARKRLPRFREASFLDRFLESVREIGEELFISPKTASVHVTHILAKLGVSSRVEAALAGSRAGIVGGGPGGAAG
jgi:hypothetical protein